MYLEADNQTCRFVLLSPASGCQLFLLISLNRSLEEIRLITFQLGQGCSVAAVKNRAVFETSMGFTPLEGLVMGTRCGDLDQAIIGYVAEHEQLSLEEIDHQLNTQSGLLGLSGQTSYMRQLLKAVHE